MLPNFVTPSLMLRPSRPAARKARNNGQFSPLLSSGISPVASRKITHGGELVIGGTTVASRSPRGTYPPLEQKDGSSLKKKFSLGRLASTTSGEDKTANKLKKR